MKGQRRGFQIARGVGLFVLGATVGSITALLCAPASGRVTRRQIALKLRTLKRQTGRELGQRIKYAKVWVTEHMPNGHNRRANRPAIHHA